MHCLCALKKNYLLEFKVLYWIYWINAKQLLIKQFSAINATTVSIRARPFLASEIESNSQKAWKIKEDEKSVVRTSDSATFKFGKFFFFLLLSYDSVSTRSEHLILLDLQLKINLLKILSLTKTALLLLYFNRLPNLLFAHLFVE